MGRLKIRVLTEHESVLIDAYRQHSIGEAFKTLMPKEEPRVQTVEEFKESVREIDAILEAGLQTSQEIPVVKVDKKGKK